MQFASVNALKVNWIVADTYWMEHESPTPVHFAFVTPNHYWNFYRRSWVGQDVRSIRAGGIAIMSSSTYSRVVFNAKIAVDELL